MTFTQKQQEYLNNANHRWNIKSGATRSGKTYLDVLAVIPIRIRAVAGKEGLTVILGNTKGTLQRNVIEPLRAIYCATLVGDIGVDNTARMFGEKVYCLGADKVTQVDRLRGSSIKYAYCDEVVTYNNEVFEMLKSRLDKTYSRCDLTCNPDNPMHWFKKFMDSDADIYLQEYSIDDNDFLSSEFVENLKKEYTGTVWYDRYILGKWVLAEGLIYPMFSTNRHVKQVTPKCDRHYIFIDYGTQNPFAALLFGVRRELGVDVAYLIKEYYYSGRANNRQLTDDDYYNELVRLADGYDIDYIGIDPSAASMIATIKKHGQFSAKKAKNDVLNGIRSVASLIAQERLYVHISCKNTIAEFQSYLWDTKSTEDRPVKDNDHAMDALRYFVNTAMAQSNFVVIGG